jgi:hypothetical protein
MNKPEGIDPADVVERAQAALKGITEGEWVQVGLGNIHRLPVGEHPPVAKTWRQSDGDFIAEARSLVPELVAEVVKLRRAGKTLGKVIDDSLTDVVNATDSHDLIGEDGDGDWMLVFERLAELRTARDAALAEVEELRAGGAWVEHVERERAMKRERDGDCICNRGPDTEGPDEFCPWHGRPYLELVDGLESQAAEIERLRSVGEVHHP